MGEIDDRPGADDGLARALLASGRAERPADGASGRAFEASVRGLGARPEAPSWAAALQTSRRALSWATPVLAAGMVAGGLVIRLCPEPLEAKPTPHTAARTPERRESDPPAEAAPTPAAASETKSLQEARSDPTRTAPPNLSKQRASQQTLDAVTSRGVDAGATRAGAGAGPHRSAIPLAQKPCVCTIGDPLCACL